MPKFVYEAFNESGTQVSGVIDADSVDLARNLLSGRGYIPTQVKEEAAGSSTRPLSSLGDRLKPVKATDLILFTKQFRTLLKAGIPVLTLLQVMENQTDNSKLKKVAASMAQDIKEGAPLYDAFKKHPKVFSNLYCSMVRAGESSGAVPEVLERVTYIIEHEHKVKSDIKSALQYPITVVIALAIAFFILLTFVIPKFVAIFRTAGLVLPLPTQVCIVLHEFLANYWYLCLGGVVAAIVLLGRYFRTEQGRYVKDSLILRLPIFGPLFIKAAMSRFASIFAILQSSGVPILNSLNILSGTIGNTAIAREFDRIRDRVEEGRGLAAPLNSAKYFTPMVTNMVAIGEESGNLDEMLREVSVHYDDEVAYAVKGLADALGPVLIVGLAGVVGFFALAIFMPLWDLTKIVR
jgi:type IV pilus assembly protein PilC